MNIVNPVDIGIIVILLVSTFMGLFRGFIREALSLASWVTAFYLAWKYAEQGSVYLEPYLKDESLRVVVAFAAIFVGALIIISIISYLIYRLFSIAGISGVDRSLGMVFGFARGIIIVGAIILAAIYTDFAAKQWWQDNSLVIYFEPVTDFLRSLISSDAVDNFKPPAGNTQATTD